MNLLKKKLALLCIMILLSSILTGFVSKEKELNWNIGQEPLTLDPVFYAGAFYESAEGGHIINNTFEGLMREINKKLEPAMTEKYEISKDKMTYTFTLRNARWSDGKPVTAQDFEYAWKRALNPEINSEYAFYFYCIKGAKQYNEGKLDEKDVDIKALDNKTLEVKLIEPTAHFLNLTTFQNFMPVRKDLVEKDPINWSINPTTAICNGPFKLLDYKFGDKIILVKNQNYWNSNNIKIDKINAMMVEKVEAVKYYDENKIDIIDAIPDREIQNLKLKFSELKILPEHTTYYYTINTTKSPLDNVKVRKALSLAIDKDMLIQKTLRQELFPANGFVPNGFKDSQNNEFRKIADCNLNKPNDRIKEAQELLIESGYPNGEGFPKIEIAFNLDPEHEHIAKMVQEMWKNNLGIDVKLQGKQIKEFRDDINEDNFLIARSGWGADYSDCSTFLNLWTSNLGDNEANWKKDDYDKLIEMSEKAEGKQRDELLYKAEKMLMDEAVIIPLYYLGDAVLVKDNIKSWEKTILGHWWFGNSYIDNMI